MKRLACFTAACVVLIGAERGQGGIVFSETFDKYATGAPPAGGWTEHYSSGGSWITREAAAANGVTQHVNDSTYFGPAGKSVHFLDGDFSGGSGLTHEFQTVTQATIEYYVLNDHVPGTNYVSPQVVFYDHFGPDRQSTGGLEFGPSGQIRILQGGQVVESALMSYEVGTWYKVRREVDCVAGTGYYYVEQASNPDTFARYDVGPGGVESLSVVGIAGAGIRGSNCYIDEMRITSANVVPEPASLIIWSLLSVGYFAIGWRRRWVS